MTFKREGVPKEWKKYLGGKVGKDILLSMDRLLKENTLYPHRPENEMGSVGLLSLARNEGFYATA